MQLTGNDGHPTWVNMDRIAYMKELRNEGVFCAGNARIISYRARRFRYSSRCARTARKFFELQAADDPALSRKRASHIRPRLPV